MNGKGGTRESTSFSFVTYCNQESAANKQSVAAFSFHPAIGGGHPCVVSALGISRTVV